MKRPWLVAVALGVTALATSAGTMALFAAQSAPQAADFTAGTLEIAGDRDHGDTVPGPMFYTTKAEGMVGGAVDAHYATGPWAPGDSHTRVFQIENIGTLDAKLISVGATLQSPDNDMPDILDVKVYGNEAKTDLLASGKLRSFLGGSRDFSSPLVLASGDLASYWFEVSMPLDAGNDYQSQSLVATFHVNAEQADHNP